MATPERTELEWTYEPVTMFEGPYSEAAKDFGLVVRNGRAVVTLNVAVHPIPPVTFDRVRAVVDSLFLVRQSQCHARYKLHGPTVYQHYAGRKDVFVHLQGVMAAVSVGQVDVKIGRASCRERV